MNQEVSSLKENRADLEFDAVQSPKFRRVWVFIVGVIILAGILFWTAGWMIHSFTHESTDDAFLDAHVVTIAPKVAGLVRNVLIRQNDYVTNGQVLVEIDPRDFEAKVEQKRASEAASEANHKTVLASYELLKTKIVTAEATAQQSKAEAVSSGAIAEHAAADLKRNEELRQRNVISTQEFDNFKTASTAAEANLHAARQKAASDESKVAEAKAQFEAAKPVIEMALAQATQAKADEHAAELDLSYTKLIAPSDGRITNKRVERGDYLQVGQALFAMVPNELWVTANFKETQLKSIRTNQPVSIEIDSVDGRAFRGHVESIQSGSGARFSLLPPENAVGNFVKVVQRVPVKIVFDEALDTTHVLGPGMSVVPSVRVNDFEMSDAMRAIVATVVAVILAVLVWILTKPKKI